MGHNIWQELVCDKCRVVASDGIHPSPPGSHLINLDAKGKLAFLDYWAERGWVYDDKKKLWICPICAEKMKGKGLL